MMKLLSAVALMLAAPAVAQDVMPVAPVAPVAPAAAVVPVAPIPVKAPEPLICRSAVETGSLVKQHKTCLTKAQWRYVNDQHESYARKMVDDNMGRPPGGP